MKITKKELIDLKACNSGLKRFMKQTDSTDEAVGVLSLIGGKNTTSDLIWLAGRTLSKEKIVRFACDCALINIEIIKPYTNDFNLIVDFLNNPSNDAVAAAYAVAASAADAVAAAYAVAASAADASAAYAAAYAVAASAADAVAASAADASAAYAAAAAGSAAAAAAADAADAVADAKINQLLMVLFTE